MFGALGRALAAMLIAYVIVVSSIADFVSHECGRFWFAEVFQQSISITALVFFGGLGIVVFLICLFRRVGEPVHWWFWIAFSVLVLIANSAFAITSPLTVTSATGGEVRCAART